MIPFAARFKLQASRQESDSLPFCYGDLGVPEPNRVYVFTSEVNEDYDWSLRQCLV